MILTNLFTKQKQTHRLENKFTVTKGKVNVRGKLGVWD